MSKELTAEERKAIRDEVYPFDEAILAKHEDLIELVDIIQIKTLAQLALIERR